MKNQTQKQLKEISRKLETAQKLRLMADGCYSWKLSRGLLLRALDIVDAAIGECVRAESPLT
jgi:hypothetical protein